MERILNKSRIIILSMILSSSVYGQDAHMEIYLETVNTSGDDIEFKFEKITSVYKRSVSGGNFVLQFTSSTDYNVATVTVPGDYEISSSKPVSSLYGFHEQNTNDPENWVLGVDSIAFAKYKLTVTQEEFSRYVYFDNRVCQAQGDIQFKWDGTTEKIYYGGLDISWTQASQGELLTIWDIKGWAEEDYDFDCIQPTDASNLSVIEGVRHPELSWTSSYPQYTALQGGAKYLVERKLDAGAYNVISSLLTSTSFTDDEVTFPGSNNYTYRILAKSGDNQFSAVGYSNTGSIQGSLGKEAPGLTNPNEKDSRLAVSVNPNPFNPITFVSFSLLAPSNVDLRIYDVRGVEVFRSIGKIFPVGHHRIMWDATKNSSGVYFYRLSVADEILRGKMLFIK